jgi:hypothetical protein
MKIFNITCCVLFVVFAALQYNDPDPYLWIPIYLYTAVLSGLAATRRYYPTAYLGGILVYGLYAVYLVFSINGLLDWLQLHDAENIAETMKAEQPWIESSREFFGLLLLIIALSINYFAVRNRGRLQNTTR